MPPIRKNTGGRPNKRKGAAQLEVLYQYDGSFAGFLSCVFEAVARREKPFGVFAEDAAPATLFESRHILADPQKAARVYASLRKKLSYRAEELVCYGFLHASPQKETVLLHFLLFAYAAERRGLSACRMPGHEAVAPVLAMERQVRHEAHQLTGFIRFAECGGVLGARITPKHDVLPLLRGHFCGRYPDEDFLIVDQPRRAALWYPGRQGGKARLLGLAEGFSFPEPGPEEAALQSMWKTFYKTVSIKARENPRCRMNLCPKRYWENMLEMQDALNGCG